MGSLVERCLFFILGTMTVVETVPGIRAVQEISLRIQGRLQLTCQMTWIWVTPRRF